MLQNEKIHERKGSVRALTVCLVFMVTLVQPPEPTGAAAIMESLMYGFEMARPSRTADLPPETQGSLAKYRERERIFSRRSNVRRVLAAHRGPCTSSAWAGSAHCSAALIDPTSRHLAEEYSTQVRLLYEWEGFAASPLTETASADAFLAQHRNSPVAPYAQLFAGHRRRCAVSGLEGLDPKSEKVRGIARDADRQLELARDAGHPLIQIVADYLVRTTKCFER